MDCKMYMKKEKDEKINECFWEEQCLAGGGAGPLLPVINSYLLLS